MLSFPVRAYGSTPAPDHASWSLESGLTAMSELAVPLLNYLLPPRRPWPTRSREDKFLPHLLGHEGVAKVLAVGAGVRHVKDGDTVVMHWRKGRGIDAAIGHRRRDDRGGRPCAGRSGARRGLALGTDDAPGGPGEGDGEPPGGARSCRAGKSRG